MRRGQVLIVVLLVLAVALTTGLSIVSRSVNEVAQSTTSDESAKALAAAEAGIEAALQGGVGQGETKPVGGSTYTVISTNVEDTKKAQIRFPEALLAGQTATLFLASHDPATGNFDLSNPNKFSGNFYVCWGDPVGGTMNLGQYTPALEISEYYVDTGVYKVSRVGIDRNGRFPDFSITVQDGCSWAVGVYGFSSTINPTSGQGLNVPNSASVTPLFIRFKMLYNIDFPPDGKAHHLGVYSGDSATYFPPQAVNVTVEGKTGSSTRTVQVANSYSAPYDIFDQAVYSGGSLGN